MQGLPYLRIRGQRRFGHGQAQLRHLQPLRSGKLPGPERELSGGARDDEGDRDEDVRSHDPGRNEVRVQGGRAPGRGEGEGGGRRVRGGGPPEGARRL